MWNCRVLKPPLYCEIKTTLKPSEMGFLYCAKKFLKKSEGSVSDHIKLLKTEHYMVKRIIYKLVNQFRSDKALKTLKQVNCCMKRLEGVNMERQMTESLQLIERNSCSRDETEFYFPCRQVLEHQLVILQGIGALLRQTGQYCQKTFLHVRQHLELGNMIPQNLLMLALISRIWYVCNSLGLYVCKWYGSLYNCLSFFKPAAVRWLQNEDLPKDLTVWLSDLFKDQQELKLMESVEAEKASGSLPASVLFLESADQEDIGEPIPRKTDVQESDGNQSKVSTPYYNDALYNNKRKHEKNYKDDEEELEASRRKKQKGLIKAEKTKLENAKMEIEYIRQSDSDASDINEEEESDLNRKHESIQVPQIESAGIEDKHPTKLPDVDISNVNDVKSHLENILQTWEDFNNFVVQIKSGTFKICENCMLFSKVGKKKILKNIGKWRSSMTNKNSQLKTEKIFLKKVRGPLSELIVKLNLNNLEESKINHQLNSGLKMDIDNKEGYVLQQERYQNLNKAEPMYIPLTDDNKFGLGYQSVSKRKEKKNNKKMKAESIKRENTGTLDHSESRDDIQTDVKSKSRSSRKRKKKSKKK